MIRRQPAYTAAVISGRVAAVFADIIGEATDRYKRTTGPLRRDVVDGLEALRAAADAWRTQQPDSVNGSAVAEVTEMGARSEPGDGTTQGGTVGRSHDVATELVDTHDAGRLLSVGERRVRQLRAAGDLHGQKVARAWMYRRADVEALAERRQRAIGNGI